MFDSPGGVPDKFPDCQLQLDCPITGGRTEGRTESDPIGLVWFGLNRDQCSPPATAACRRDLLSGHSALASPS